MTRQSSPKSALSEPESFISETRLRRAVRQYGWVIWTIAVCGLLGIGAVVFVASRQRQPAEQLQAVALPKTSGPVASTAPPTPPTPAPTTAPMPPPPAKSDLWTPWKAPESRRVVEQGESVPEQIADLPPPALEPQSETSSPSSGTASTDPATSATPPKPADATASLPAKPEAVGSGEEDKVAGTESLVPNEKVKAADGYLSRGQITIARYIYEEAFKAGDVLGAIGMARSYDPAYLKSIRSRATGQTEKAALWYRRAAEMTARASKSP